MNEVLVEKKFVGFRSDNKALFEKTLDRFSTRKHDRFIVLSGDDVVVEKDPIRVLEYPPDSDVIVTWTGKWNSDIFRFKVKDLCEYHDKIMKEKQ